jgi:Flp pilus assembly protein protease CpaA
MRGSVIWFVLAVAWGVDCLLAFFHHNRVQGGLTALFAGCFLVVGLFFRRREQKLIRKPQVPLR